MQVYLVGGAVRDELLEYPFSERDWVVVGATPDLMLQQGYQQVGKDFPVFLHPVSKEEYALARTERKQGIGYTGFAVHAEPTVTLEEDLLRRDLTINAMAKSADGKIVDPYGGLADLKAKRLRHVSPAFAEDPLRILRVARFAARYAEVGFTVVPETLCLMRELVESGELLTLSPERVWRETEKALTESSPDVYFDVLRQCGALQVLLPEVDALFGVPQNSVSHPEIDTGEHSFMVLRQAAKLSSDSAVRYASLVHDVGKALTPIDQLPSHPGHEEASILLLNNVQHRLKVPNRHADLASLVARYHTCLHGLKNRPVSEIQAMIVAIGVYRQGDYLKEFIACCRADHMGRLGHEKMPYPQADWLVDLVGQCKKIDVQKIVDEGYSGAAIGQQLIVQREAIICQFLATIA